MALTRSRFLSCLLAGAAVLTAPAAFAQEDFPSHTLKLVVPFAPGGATDILGRQLAAAFSEKLGQTMIVENRPGAGTVVGAGLVAKAPADGYTLLLAANTTLTLNPVIRESLPYDPLKFSPIGQVADMGLLLVANNDVPARTLADFVALAKASPDKYSYGSFGVGASVHFGGEMLKTATGIRLLHVPFNGSTPNLTALMGGQVQVAVDTVVAATPLIKGGKIKPLAALGAQRLKLLPEVPTVAESGYPGFDMSSWFGLVGPADMPAAVRQKLEKTLARIMADPAMRQKLTEVGLTPNWGDGAALQARIERELPQMRAVAARANIHTE